MGRRSMGVVDIKEILVQWDGTLRRRQLQSRLRPVAPLSREHKYRGQYNQRSVACTQLGCTGDGRLCNVLPRPLREVRIPKTVDAKWIERSRDC